MLLVAKIKSGAPGIPENATVTLEFDLPQAAGVPDSHGDRRLTQEDVMARYGVDRKTVYRWRKAGLLPSFSIGAAIYFKESELDAMEERCRQQVRPVTVKQVPFPIRVRAAQASAERRAA